MANITHIQEGNPMGIVESLDIKDKRVLITGADGFIGSHLTEELLKQGAQVSVYVRATSGPSGFSLKNIAALENNVSIIKGDIGSSDSIDLIAKDQPEVILHLAAIAYVNYSFDHPIEVNNVNVNGTLNVLEAAKKIDLDRLVVQSSSEVYGTTIGESIDENHPLLPSSPYAASKLAADRYAFSYMKTYGLPISIIRPFNVYGPRHTYDVIPKFIRLALDGKPLTVYGSGMQSRDFCYVSDIVRAILLMGFHEKALNEVVNFGSGIDTTIVDLANNILELTGSKILPVFLSERQAEVDRLRCNYSKASELFGWDPEVSLMEGLALNIAWCRENRGN